MYSTEMGRAIYLLGLSLGKVTWPGPNLAVGSLFQDIGSQEKDFPSK